MAVSTTTSSGGLITAYTGTLQEVLDALDTAEMNNLAKIHIYYNGTNITAVILPRA